MGINVGAFFGQIVTGVLGELIGWHWGFGAAGVVELTAGYCITLGVFTRPLALLASGEMAVAYFWMHWAGSGHMWWWQNRGEIVLLYSFIWLYFAALGAGPFSVDGWLRRGRSAA